MAWINTFSRLVKVNASKERRWAFITAALEYTTESLYSITIYCIQECIIQAQYKLMLCFQYTVKTL